MSNRPQDSGRRDAIGRRIMVGDSTPAVPAQSTSTLREQALQSPNTPQPKYSQEDRERLDVLDSWQRTVDASDEAERIRIRDRVLGHRARVDGVEGTLGANGTINIAPDEHEMLPGDIFRMSESGEAVYLGDGGSTTHDYRYPIEGKGYEPIGANDRIGLYSAVQHDVFSEDWQPPSPPTPPPGDSIEEIVERTETYNANYEQPVEGSTKLCVSSVKDVGSGHSIHWIVEPDGTPGRRIVRVEHDSRETALIASYNAGWCSQAYDIPYHPVVHRLALDAEDEHYRRQRKQTEEDNRKREAANE